MSVIAVKQRIVNTPILLWALLSVALGFSTGIVWPIVAESFELPPPGEHFAAPDNRELGEPSREAVDSAQTQAEFPVLWLGEQFQGYNLTLCSSEQITLPAAVAKSETEMKAWTGLLIYGWCDTTKDPVNNSCPPPIELVIHTPGIVPSPDDEKLWKPGMLSGEPRSVRGARAIPVDLGTMLLFDNGYAVTIYSDANVRDAIIDALVLANAHSVGSAQAGEPGSDLSFIAGLQSAPMSPVTE